MIPVVSSPTKCQLAQIARSDNQSSQLIGQVHQYLCAFARLRILISYVMNLRIMSDVFKMLHHGLGNIDFANGDAKTLHQGYGIVVSAIGRSESRHRHTDDAFAVITEFVESLHADKQRQRRIQSAADSDNNRLAPGMHQPFGQPCHLDVEDLFAGTLHLL